MQGRYRHQVRSSPLVLCCLCCLQRHHLAPISHWSQRHYLCRRLPRLLLRRLPLLPTDLAARSFCCSGRLWPAAAGRRAHVPKVSAEGSLHVRVQERACIRQPPHPHAAAAQPPGAPAAAPLLACVALLLGLPRAGRCKADFSRHAQGQVDACSCRPGRAWRRSAAVRAKPCTGRAVWHHRLAQSHALALFTSRHAGSSPLFRRIGAAAGAA